MRKSNRIISPQGSGWKFPKKNFELPPPIVLDSWVKTSQECRPPTKTPHDCILGGGWNNPMDWEMGPDQIRLSNAAGNSTQVLLQAQTWTNFHPSKVIPSRKLTYPTLGKGKSSSNMPYQGDMLIPWRVIRMTPFQWWITAKVRQNHHGSPSTRPIHQTLRKFANSQPKVWRMAVRGEIPPDVPTAPW